MSGCMFERAAFLEVGGFDPGLHYVEDLHLWLKLARTYDFVMVAEPLARIRVHEANLSRNLQAASAERVQMLRGLVPRNPIEGKAIARTVVEIRLRAKFGQVVESIVPLDVE